VREREREREVKNEGGRGSGSGEQRLIRLRPPIAPLQDRNPQMLIIIIICFSCFHLAWYPTRTTLIQFLSFFLSFFLIMIHESSFVGCLSVGLEITRWVAPILIFPTFFFSSLLYFNESGKNPSRMKDSMYKKRK